MTKEDFIVIAALLRAIFNSEFAKLDDKQKEFIVQAFIGELMKTNDRFDIPKFWKACGFAGADVRRGQCRVQPAAGR